MGRVRELHGAGADYMRELESRFRDLDLSGRRVLLDCANGATYRVAPEIFRRLGAEVDAVAVEPDGRNINAGCGSTYVEALAPRVTEGGYDAAFAFDGDGDRLLAVDRSGAVVDGDELMALAALHLREAGRLAGGGVAVTVMTNFGFHQAMKEHGIEVATTPVGDRYVLAELLERGWTLGGEQSGHIIDTGFVPAGDGIASALLTLEALGDRDLADRGAMRKLPQKLVNVRVRDRDALDDAAAVWQAVEEESRSLDGRGRVLVRPSGTEPLVRVMVEAPGEDECRTIVERLVRTVESELG
jgi:phosphoglucosamine mutase